MTNEEKQLLLRDLCGRLPYGVKMKYKDDSGYEVLCQIDTFYKDVNGFCCLLRTTGPYGEFQDLNELKPYLRPMSSMTEEEKKMVCSMNGLSDTELNDRIEYPNMYVQNYTIETFDLFNAHHLDYRGLIEKGLALKAQKDMYEKL